MKVILVSSVVLVLFALIFPVAAAWSSVPEVPAQEPPQDARTPETPDEPNEPDEPEGGSPFYVPEISDPAPSGDGSVTVRLLDAGQVRNVSLSDYLTLSLAAEMPASFEPEALRAQAVALRTYYMYKLSHPSHAEADICSDSACCAAWRDEEFFRDRWGADFEANMAKIRAAVEDTDGLILTYGGKAALAVFHSSSAGRTEDSEAVWSAPLPYLVSVASPESADTVPNFSASVTVSAQDFRETILGAYPDADLTGPVSDWIGEAVFTSSGRVESVPIGGVSVPGTALRSLFSLRSTALTFDAGEDAITITSQGYGHGVGMSQYGANVMAAGGADFREILENYYPGTELQRSV